MAKRKTKKRGKKKKSGLYYTGKVIAFPFKAVYWILKNGFKGTKYVYKKLDERKQVVQEKNKIKQIKAKRPKAEAKYQKFSIIKNMHGEYSDFENLLKSSSSTIGIILGARGTGKSAIGMKILENVKAETGRSICAMGFKEETMPEWIKIVSSTDDIPNKAFVLIDEGGITFSSRESMSDANKLLSTLLLIARHRDISVLFISQNSSNLEVNAIRQTDYLILKPSSLLQKDFERKKIKQIYEEVDEEFSKLKKEKSTTYIYSDEYRGFVKNPLPSFWSSKVSKSWS